MHIVFRMVKSAPLLVVLLCWACVKARNTGDPKTSELVPHFGRTVAGSFVICTAWFSLESDPSNTPVTLEAEALMTCNGSLMTASGSTYLGSTSYSPGVEVAISLIRRIDGTNLTDTEAVF